MFKDITRTISDILKLRSIVGYNGFVYALKQTPIIGKLFPDRLYGLTALKIIYWIFLILKEIFLLFIGKIAGLGLVYAAAKLISKLYVTGEMTRGLSEQSLFGNFAVFFFLVYAIAGLVINTTIFRCTTEKEYMVFMLRMNAKKINNALFVYDQIKLVIGYLMTGLVAAIAGAPIWAWLGIPVLAIFIKCFGAGAQAASYRRKHKHGKLLKTSRAWTTAGFLIIMVLLPLTMVIIINGYFVPLKILAIICAGFIVLGTWGLLKLIGFDANLHKRALKDNIVREEVEMTKNPDNSRQFKRLTAKGSVSSTKKGFEYLNVLFVRRHWSMIALKPIVVAFIMFAIMCLTIYIFISTYTDDFGGANTMNMIRTNLINLVTFKGYEDKLRPYDVKSAMSFFRYLVQTHLFMMIVPIQIADNSFKATQAMYINCDSCLMTFGFFKRNQKIIKLFDIRLRQLIKNNLAPVIVLGAAANLILFYTGGQDYPLQYLATILIIFLIATLNSLAALGLYYIFQPFTKTANVKGGAYIVTRAILVFVALVTFWIPIDSLILLGVLTIITTLAVLVVRKLVYKLSPRTWRVRS